MEEQRSRGEEEQRGSCCKFFPFAPMRHAQYFDFAQYKCPMPNAQCPMPSPQSLIFKGDCLCQWLLYLD
ncbi:hypothetical protein GXM_03887 [Nostoc sphaeroides CCNUC1]|uniref:Uncharacterized protein n=1 Tax=Nostoc sphaeroides CCNUC1 TaxID=2653204 RepID=A0A5P8W2C0_9NOSO|nr:hypothetical protein GXM_03887 [Nostoc sphaeroides CCNUC1]